MTKIICPKREKITACIVIIKLLAITMPVHNIKKSSLTTSFACQAEWIALCVFRRQCSCLILKASFVLDSICLYTRCGLPCWSLHIAGSGSSFLPPLWIWRAIEEEDRDDDSRISSCAGGLCSVCLSAAAINKYLCNRAELFLLVFHWGNRKYLRWVYLSSSRWIWSKANIGSLQRGRLAWCSGISWCHAW